MRRAVCLGCQHPGAQHPSRRRVSVGDRTLSPTARGRLEGGRRLVRIGWACPSPRENSSTNPVRTVLPRNPLG